MKKVKVGYVISLAVLFAACFTTSKNSDWTIEWQFEEELNSTGIFVYDSFFIANSLSNTIRKGVIDSLGQLMISITVPGFEDDVIIENPTLHCVVKNKTDTVFDSIFSWNEMNFVRQYSLMYSDTMENVSKKIFFCVKQ